MASISRARMYGIAVAMACACCFGTGSLAQDGSPEALYMNGIQRFQAGKYAEALPFLQELLNVFGREPEFREQMDLVMYAKACALYNLQAYADSITAFEEYRAQYPNSKFADESYFRVGVAHQQLDDLEKAIEAYQELRANYPRSGYNEDALFQIGLCLLILERGGEAVPIFLEFLGEYPESPLFGQAGAFAARALFDAGSAEEAVQMLERIEKYPMSWSVVTYCNFLAFEVGDFLFDETDYDTALKAYRRVKPKEALLRHQRAFLESLEAEMAQMKRATRSTDSSNFRQERRLSNDIAQAEELVTQLEELPDYDATLYHRIGRCFFNNDLFWEARVAFTRAVAVATDDKVRETAHFDLILSISRLRRFDELIQEADIYLETFDPEGGW